MSEAENRINKIKSEFEQIDNWEDKYKKIIAIGRESDDLAEKYCIDKFKIKGCQSQVWLRPAYQNGIVSLTATSDAVLVKGIISLLVNVYSGLSPEEILHTDAGFLKEIGITEHLSMNRTNGLASMLKQIQMYAVAYKTLSEKGILSIDS